MKVTQDSSARYLEIRKPDPTGGPAIFFIYSGINKSKIQEALRKFSIFKESKHPTMPEAMHRFFTEEPNFS